MKETCCQFGPNGRLSGIVTEPREGAPTRALVLVSAGLLPKFGPFRLYAELARRLAEDGVLTLRFDLGGIGDSAADGSGRQLRVRSELEIRAAVDYLSERWALSDLVLGGLCSGAEDSFRSAAIDTRVTGVLLIDPFAYRTRGWQLRDAWHRLGRRTLRAAGLYQPLRRPLAVGSTGPTPRAVTYKYMERSESTPLLRTLLARNAHVHFVYTGGLRDVFNHPSQFHRQFDDLELTERVTLDHLPELDHTQLLEADRGALIEAVSRRFREQALAVT